MKIYLDNLSNIQIVYEMEIRDGSSYTQTFKGNFTDGRRHFVFVRFWADKLMLKVQERFFIKIHFEIILIFLQVDRQHHDLIIETPLPRLQLLSYVLLGGTDPNPTEEILAVDNFNQYTGCLSSMSIPFKILI